MPGRPDSPPRIGYCCVFIPPGTGTPAEDKKEARRTNLAGTTIAALSRLDRAACYARVLDLVRHNLAALEYQIARLAALPPIERLLRLGSDVLPAYTHAVARWMYDEPELRQVVERGLGGVGALARRGGVRLSFHPGPFCVLATLNEATLRNAVQEFEYHADMMRWMGYAGGWHPHGAHVNIHVGSAAGGVPESLDRFRAALPLLSEDARGLITVENDEMMFGLDDVLRLADRLPVVLDFHHHWVATGEYLRPDDPRIAAVRQSWRGVRPVSHISVSAESLLPDHPADLLPDHAMLTGAGARRTELRAHSDRMWNGAVNDWMAAHLSWTDLEVEAKHKNLASRQLAEWVEARRRHQPGRAA